ncbi:MAG: hypothetical protein HOV83_34415 [Catenulispora sp.]|nr:hypothetical protein [Catenulispora sp.]
MGMTEYGSMLDPVFNADGTLDIKASEKNPARSGENRVARVRTINLGREALTGPPAHRGSWRPWSNCARYGSCARCPR